MLNIYIYIYPQSERGESKNLKYLHIDPQYNHNSEETKSQLNFLTFTSRNILIQLDNHS